MNTVPILLTIGLAIALVVSVWALRRLCQIQRQVDSLLEEAGAPAGSDRFRELTGLVRRLEADVERSEIDAERLRAAVDQTDLGIIITDVDGDVVFANPSGRGVLDGKLADVAARSRLSRLINRVTSTGRSEELEFDVYTPVRRYMWMRAAALPGQSEHGHAALVYIRDLSGKRKVEAMRRDFLTNAGHEMKTPLGALAVLAETIADTDDPVTRRRLSERLRSEATRMAQVVDDVLALANIESLETPFEPVDVEEVVRAAIGRVGIAARDRGVVIQVTVADATVWVDGAWTQIESAIVNLIDNAVSYSPPDEGAVVDVGILTDGDEVMITVEDHGIGIPAAHVDRVFERFYRVQSGRGRSSGGTGLGLSIVRNVAETHGGAVSVVSTPAEGSTFTMRLPIMRR